MSYEISYRRKAFVLPAAMAGYWDDIHFLLEETGSNNCYECGSGRRSRSWECLAAGAPYVCMQGVVTVSAGCEGGMLSLNGRRGTTPEGYIRAWRKAVADAETLTRESLRDYTIELYIAIDDKESTGTRRHAFEALSSAGAPAGVRKLRNIDDRMVTEWRFDLWNPDQVRLWIDNHPHERGWHYVRVTGPA